MKRLTAFILCILMMSAFVSCSETDTNEYFITVGDTKLVSAVYYSELYGYKIDFLESYLGLTEDNAPIWTQDSPNGRGETVGDALKRMALEDMVQFAWVVEYARNNGAALTEQDLSEIEESIASTKEDFETEEEYQEYMDFLKFTDETLRAYLEDTFIYDKGFEMLIAEGGDYAISEDAFDKFYEENFYTVKHIFINNVNKETDDGETVELTEDEIAAQNDKAQSIYDDLQNGSEFDILFMLSEDNMSESYPNGLTFTEGMIDSAYEEAVKNLEIGEYTMVNGSYGGVYIVKRLEISEADREQYESYIKNAVYTDVQTEIYNDHKDEVSVNYDIVNSYKMEDIPID